MRRPGLIDQFRKKLLEGMLTRGLSGQYAEAVFQQIRGFGDYGFPESHAASFALLVYVSAWLKRYYMAAFTAAILNSQPMGFYAPAQLVRSARDHGVEVRPADVNYSDWDCTLEAAKEVVSCPLPVVRGGPATEVVSCQLPVVRGWPATEYRQLTTDNRQLTTSALAESRRALRLGFRMLNGMSEAHAKRIVQVRGDKPFRSLDDFSRRTGLSRAVATRLAKAAAFGSLGLDRRNALWHAMAQDQKELPLFDRVCNAQDTRPGQTANDAPSSSQSPNSAYSAEAGLPKMTLAEEVLADYRTSGLSLSAHPLEFLREGLDKMDVTPAARLRTWPHGKPVRVAGIVLVRQRPGTAKGITFVTLEDETGTANLIIRPDVWQKFRQAALGATLLLAQGRLQRQGLVIHILVTRLENLSSRLQALGPQSRDFC